MVLVHDARAGTTKLDHLGANAEQEADVDAHGTDVGARLACDPENAKTSLSVKLKKLGLVDASDAQLTFNGRDERWTLEHGTGQSLDCLGQFQLVGNGIVHLENASDPGDNLVTGRIGRFVNVDDAGSDIILDWPLKWRAAGRDWGEVRRANIQLIPTLQQQQPVGRVGLDFILAHWRQVKVATLLYLADVSHFRPIRAVPH